jgi:hypothetical protein
VRTRPEKKGKEGHVMIRSIINSLSFIAAFVLAVAFTLVFNLPVHAQAPGDIKVHFDSQVAVPGHLLAAGDYIFRRVNSDDPHLYEVLADGGNNFVGFIRVISAQRAQLGDTEVDLSPADGSGVRMVQVWYPAGETEGYELSYSDKDRRKLDELARAQTQKQEQATAYGQP